MKPWTFELIVGIAVTTSTGVAIGGNTATGAVHSPVARRSDDGLRLTHRDCERVAAHFYAAPRVQRSRWRQ